MPKELELLKEQNELLKGLLLTTVEILPRHSAGCYGLQVHPGNRERCCNCKMHKVKNTVRVLLGVSNEQPTS